MSIDPLDGSLGRASTRQVQLPGFTFLQRHIFERFNNYFASVLNWRAPNLPTRVLDLGANGGYHAGSTSFHSTLQTNPALAGLVRGLPSENIAFYNTGTAMVNGRATYVPHGYYNRRTGSLTSYSSLLFHESLRFRRPENPRNQTDSQLREIYTQQLGIVWDQQGNGTRAGFKGRYFVRNDGLLGFIRDLNSNGHVDQSVTIVELCVYSPHTRQFHALANDIPAIPPPPLDLTPRGIHT